VSQESTPADFVEITRKGLAAVNRRDFDALMARLARAANRRPARVPFSDPVPGRRPRGAKALRRARQRGE